MKTRTDNTKAIDAFLTKKAEFDAMLRNLSDSAFQEGEFAA